MIPNDIWRYIAEIGDPLVRFKLACCNYHLHSILEPLKLKPLIARIVPLPIDMTIIMSPTATAMFWQRWADYESKWRSDHNNVAHNVPLVTLCDVPNVYSILEANETTIRRCWGKYNGLFFDDAADGQICQWAKVYRDFPFAMYEYFDVRKRVTLARRPCTGKRKSTKRHPGEMDQIEEQLRYNLIVHIDQLNRKAERRYCEPSYQAGRVYQPWHELSPEQLEAQYIDYTLDAMAYLLKYIAARYTFVSCLERNLIHFAIYL